MRIWKSEVADALDPSNATLQLATGDGTTAHTPTLGGWVVVIAVAGVVLTRRRAASLSAHVADGRTFARNLIVLPLPTYVMLRAHRLGKGATRPMDMADGYLV
ncbi:hypothetical protein GCM10010531_43680 [Blastococcus jejuensis]|uniref:LPXTG cell wall anchor domain-containing protein n=1 Tax=Blastococcus jejuensis TaxID=351224 RepID=A0ABP6PPT6_9ACTN